MKNENSSAKPLQTAFVTGGSGFVGRRLVTMLRERGIAVRALVRSDSATQTVQKLGAEPVQGDLNDESALIAGMRGCDAVFHVAANTADWGPQEASYHANVQGTEHVLAAARTAGVPRLVHVSTEAVLLGGAPIIQVDETRSRPAHPMGIYGSTKALAEQRVVEANTPGIFETVVVRPRFVWGKGDTTVLARLVSAVKSGSYLWIDGGHYLTSTCNVTNACEGLIVAAERGHGGAIYFVTDGAPIEFRTFVTAMLRTQGVTPGNQSIPLWLARTIASLGEWAWATFHLKGMPPLTRTAVRVIGEEVTVSDAKARRELGYHEIVSREAGLSEMTLLS